MKSQLTRIHQTDAPGALVAEASVAQGSFLFDHLAYFEDAKLATEATAEADYKKGSLYLGPEYQTLDLGLQDEFEKYMHDRGVDAKLGSFIAMYADLKDQKVCCLLSCVVPR